MIMNDTDKLVVSILAALIVGGATIWGIIESMKANASLTLAIIIVGLFIRRGVPKHLQLFAVLFVMTFFMIISIIFQL
jgi:hypothetical protein